MPIYEYRCAACEHAFEHLARSMTAGEKVVCPECGSPRAQRQLSVFAARQGSGSAAGCDLMPGAPRCPQCPGMESCAL